MTGFILICGGMLLALAILWGAASSQDQKYKRNTDFLLAMYKAKEEQKKLKEEKDEG